MLCILFRAREEASPIAGAKYGHHQKADRQKRNSHRSGKGPDNSYYHNILGYLYESINIDKAIEHYKQAKALTKSRPGQQTMQRK